MVKVKQLLATFALFALVFAGNGQAVFATQELEQCSNSNTIDENCFEVEVVQECGYIDIQVGHSITEGWVNNYTDGEILYWAEPADDPLDGEIGGGKGWKTGDLPFPMTFDEDENNGEVVVEWHLDGVEYDYVTWGAGQTTVDTDCEEEGEVLGEAAVVEKEEQVVAPVGAVDAGAGVTGSVASAASGLVASVVAAGAGVARFVRKRQ